MMKRLNFNDFWNAGAIHFTMILDKQNLVFFLGSFGYFGSKKNLVGFLWKKLFLASWPFPSKEIILKTFIDNVLTCLPNMLTFAFKEWRSKITYCRNQLWKMQKCKKWLCWKNCALSIFLSIIKKNLSFTQFLASEKPPKKYAFSDATVFISLNIF